MRHSASAISYLFDAGIPKTDDPEVYKQFERLRDRLVSVAYRLVRDLPDNEYVDELLKSLCEAQACGNLAIIKSIGESNA